MLRSFCAAIGRTISPRLTKNIRQEIKNLPTPARHVCNTAGKNFPPTYTTASCAWEISSHLGNRVLEDGFGRHKHAHALVHRYHYRPDWRPRRHSQADRRWHRSHPQMAAGAGYSAPPLASYCAGHRPFPGRPPAHSDRPTLPPCGRQQDRIIHARRPP